MPTHPRVPVHAGSADKPVGASSVPTGSCGPLRFPAAIDMPRRVTIQTENGLDTRPREFSEINRTIMEFPFAIIATDKQIEETMLSVDVVGLLDDSG